MQIKKLLFGISIIFLSAQLSLHSYAQSTDIDKKLGAENAKSVAVEMGIYESEDLTAYVDAIGQRLVKHLDNPLFDYQFHVVDDPIPNAFALPGGFIYVTRGILALITTEDELACVMGHEIIHSQNRHSVKQIGNSIIPKLLELPGKLVGKVIHEDVGRILNAPIETSNALLLASYSRGHETESDTEGVALASKAGYDPSAMKDILSRLDNAVELVTKQKAQKSYFDDHPMTADRLKNITKVAGKLTWTETGKIAADFPTPLNNLLFGYNPDKGVFDETKFIHPVMDFTFQFPDKWMTENTPNSVNGMNKKNDAALVLGMDDPSKSAKELAMAFSADIEKEYKAKPIASDYHQINDAQGYVLSYLDKSERKDMYIHILWMKLNDQMFKIIGMGPKSAEAKLKKAVLSLRPLNDEEKQNLTKKVMRVVKSENESFEELCKRYNTTQPADIIAFLNAMDPKKDLKQGTLVKILVEEKYFN